MKIHQHFAGHMTKMATMPIYGKNILEILFPGTTGLVDFDLLNGKVKVCKLGFYMGKCDNDGLFGNYCIL